MEIVHRATTVRCPFVSAGVRQASAVKSTARFEDAPFDDGADVFTLWLTPLTPQHDTEQQRTSDALERRAKVSFLRVWLGASQFPEVASAADVRLAQLLASATECEHVECYAHSQTLTQVSFHALRSLPASTRSFSLLHGLPTTKFLGALVLPPSLTALRALHVENVSCDIVSLLRSVPRTLRTLTLHSCNSQDQRAIISEILDFRELEWLDTSDLTAPDVEALPTSLRALSIFNGKLHGVSFLHLVHLQRLRCIPALPISALPSSLPPSLSLLEGELGVVEMRAYRTAAAAVSPTLRVSCDTLPMSWPWPRYLFD